jgi:undecaprenyl diphosphate synthase
MKIPKHVAIIMDGNRRWARQQGLKATVGHQKMVDEGIQKVVTEAKKLGIKYLTLWAFSTENWDRDPQEIEFLMKLFRKMFDVEAKKLHERGVKILTIGDLSHFDQDIQAMAKKWVDESSKNTDITVVFALNYGGRDEMLRAAEKIVHDVEAGVLPASKLTAQQFSQYLDTANIPDPELIIRPGGEQRLSGFLLWQSNYAELYFTKVLMPDFDGQELKKAVKEFDKRRRRFGQ